MQQIHKRKKTSRCSLDFGESIDANHGQDRQRSSSPRISRGRKWEAPPWRGPVQYTAVSRHGERIEFLMASVYSHERRQKVRAKQKGRQRDVRGEERERYRGAVVDPIVLSDGFGGIVDTHGIIRGILITGNPTKHPYHPPMLSLYVIRCTPHRWNIELALNDFEIIVALSLLFIRKNIHYIFHENILPFRWWKIGGLYFDVVVFFFFFFKIIARSFTFSRCVFV